MGTFYVQPTDHIFGSKNDDNLTFLQDRPLFMKAIRNIIPLKYIWNRSKHGKALIELTIDKHNLKQEIPQLELYIVLLAFFN